MNHQESRWSTCNRALLPLRLVKLWGSLTVESGSHSAPAHEKVSLCHWFDENYLGPVSVYEGVAVIAAEQLGNGDHWHVLLQTKAGIDQPGQFTSWQTDFETDDGSCPLDGSEHLINSESWTWASWNQYFDWLAKWRIVNVSWIVCLGFVIFTYINDNLRWLFKTVFWASVTPADGDAWKCAFGNFQITDIYKSEFGFKV